MLDTALSTGRAPAAIDWYAVEDAWTSSPDRFRTRPEGDPYALATQARDLVDATA